MIGASIFSSELFGHDFRTHFKRQRKVCKCCFQLATFQLDHGKYRDNHGYPKYYERLQCNSERIKNFNLEEMYKGSLAGHSEDVRPVFA